MGHNDSTVNREAIILVLPYAYPYQPSDFLEDLPP